MPQAQFVVSHLSTDGGSTGVLTLASNAGFASGAIVYLSSSTQEIKTLKIRALIGGTQFTVYDPYSKSYYTNFDSSSYLVADSAMITQPTQDVAAGSISVSPVVPPIIIPSTSHYVSCEVDFGIIPGAAATECKTSIVGLSWMTSLTKILCSPSGEVTSDHPFVEDYALDNIYAYATNPIPGIGFDIICTSVYGARGKFIINCMGI